MLTVVSTFILTGDNDNDDEHNIFNVKGNWEGICTIYNVASIVAIVTGDKDTDNDHKG